MARSHALSRHISLEQAAQEIAHTTPPGKPRSLQKDGDIRKIWWEVAAQKNPRSVTISKVKGHLTDKDIEDGKGNRRTYALNASPD